MADRRAALARARHPDAPVCKCGWPIVPGSMHVPARDGQAARHLGCGPPWKPRPLDFDLVPGQPKETS